MRFLFVVLFPFFSCNTLALSLDAFSRSFSFILMRHLQNTRTSRADERTNCCVYVCWAALTAIEALFVAAKRHKLSQHF